MSFSLNFNVFNWRNGASRSRIPGEVVSAKYINWWVLFPGSFLAVLPKWNQECGVWWDVKGLLVVTVTLSGWWMSPVDWPGNIWRHLVETTTGAEMIGGIECRQVDGRWNDKKRWSSLLEMSRVAITYLDYRRPMWLKRTKLGKKLSGVPLLSLVSAWL